MILYYCSDGSRVSQATIEKNYLKARREKYSGSGSQWCRGCGLMNVNGSAHTIAQAECKVIHKTELIWDKKNFWPACVECNRAIENPKGSSWKNLRNIFECLSFIKQHHIELYRKFEANAGDFKFTW